MRRLIVITTALLASLWATGAWAENDACGYSEFVDAALQDGAQLYSVAIPGRAYFQSCAEPICRLKSYVVGKDQVLVSQVRGGWACAWFAGSGTAGSGTVGWLKAADLRKVAHPSPATATWPGAWTFGSDSQITIRPDKSGGVTVEGDTVNAGLAGQPSGYFKGRLVVSGAAARYDDAGGDCHVHFRRIDRYLVAREEAYGCGGMGATFTGVYRR